MIILTKEKAEWTAIQIHLINIYKKWLKNTFMMLDGEMN